MSVDFHFCVQCRLVLNKYHDTTTCNPELPVKFWKPCDKCAYLRSISLENREIHYIVEDNQIVFVNCDLCLPCAKEIEQELCKNE